MATPPKSSSEKYLRRVECPGCRASIPVVERDANDFCECFCGEHIPAGPRAFQLLARAKVKEAIRRGQERETA
jgi:hypothetical protein